MKRKLTTFQFLVVACSLRCARTTSALPACDQCRKGFDHESTSQLLHQEKAALMSQLRPENAASKLPPEMRRRASHPRPTPVSSTAPICQRFTSTVQLGWNFLTTVQALALRGSTREVLLKPRLIEVLQTRRYQYKGRVVPAVAQRHRADRAGAVGA